MPLARDGCSRICSCQSIREHCETTTFTIAAANHSITNRWKRSISTDFNSSLKLVRDQGVGGSNPLSPTNNFSTLQSLNKLKNRPSGFSPGSLLSEDASFLGFSPSNGCSDSYKIVHRRMTLCPLSCRTMWFFKVCRVQPIWAIHNTTLSHSYCHRFRREGQPQLATSEDSISICCKNDSADHSYMRMSCDLDWFGLGAHK
jgi:hypothetical protein